MNTRIRFGNHWVSDLTGQKFGRLTAVEVVVIDGRVRWKCRCDCGAEVVHPSCSLTSGNTRSCGCLAREYLCAPKKHGEARGRFYGVWSDMKQRCLNPEHKSYHRYGGRGIVICERWMDFDKFREDMHGGYRAGLSIDRIDVNGPYAPENARWATREQQNNNKESSRYIEFGGVRLTVTQWARRLGLTAPGITGRIEKGWPIEKVLSPVRYKKGQALVSSAA